MLWWVKPGWPRSLRRSVIVLKGIPSVIHWLTSSRMALGRRATLPLGLRAEIFTEGNEDNEGVSLFAIDDLGFTDSSSIWASLEGSDALFPLTLALSPGERESTGPASSGVEVLFSFFAVTKFLRLPNIFFILLV